MKITVEGQPVNVSDDFAKLSPDDQEKTVNEIAQALKAPDAVSDPRGNLSTGNVVRAAARGVPIIGGALNTLDAATNAALAPAVEPFLSPSADDISRQGESFGERFRKSKQRLESRDAAFEAQHPYVDTAAEIAGGVGATLPVAATAAGARALGMTGSLPGMVARGAASGAAINAADAAVRGQDPVQGAELGAIVNAAAPIVARGVGKAVQAVRNKVNPPPMQAMNVENVAGVDVPLTQSQVTGDAAQSAEEQILQRGGRGEPAQRVATDFNDLQGQRVQAASDNISGAMDPTGQMARTAPNEAAERVAAELRDLETQRAAAQMSHNAATAQEGDAIRTSMRPAGATADVADTPLRAAEVIGDSLRTRAAAGREARTAAYQALGDVEGEFAPASFQRIGASIRRRISAGDQPVFVDRRNTPIAAQALDDIDNNIGQLRFENLARNGALIPGPDGRPMAPPITAQTLENARKRLVSLYGDARRARAAPNGAGDYRAMSAIMNAFNDHIDEVLRGGGFLGDAAEYQARTTAARGSHANYRQAFAPRNSDDDVGKIIEKAIGRFDDSAPTAAHDFASKLFGSAGEPGGGTAIRMAQRVRSQFGENSREWAAYKQGLLAHITDTAEGTAARSPEQTADRMMKFLNGSKGRGLAQVVFSPAERQRLAAHATQVRATAPAPKASTDVDRIMARISGADGHVPAPVGDIVDWLYGRTGAGNKGISVKLAERLKQELSPEAWTAVRQGMWQKLVNAGEGKIEFEAQKLSQRLHEFLNESGEALAKVLYTKQERDTMRKLASVYKQMIPVKGTTNPSGTAPMLKKIADKTGSTMLALLGFSHGGLPGAALAMGAERAIHGIRNSRAASDAVKRFYGPQPVAPLPRTGQALSILTQGGSPAGIDQRR